MATDRYRIVGNWPVPGGTAPAILDPLNKPQSSAVADACTACGQPPCALVCIFEEFGIYTECVLRLLNSSGAKIDPLPKLHSLVVGEVISDENGYVGIANALLLGRIIPEESADPPGVRITEVARYHDGKVEVTTPALGKTARQRTRERREDEDRKTRQILNILI